MKSSSAGSSRTEKGAIGGSGERSDPRRVLSAEELKPSAKTKSSGEQTSKPSSSSSSRGSASSSGRASSGGKKSKPSDVLNPKTIDPFKGHQGATAFASVYNSGGMPCRLVHGSVKHKLAWNPIPEDLPFDPILITLAEGIRETVHPYTSVARMGFKEILASSGASAKAMPLVPKLVAPLRAALSHSDSSVFDAGLDALCQLSAAVGPALNAYLKSLLPAMNKHVFDKKFKEKISDILHQIEQNGGKECSSVIKAKVPTYASIYS